MPILNIVITANFHSTLLSIPLYLLLYFYNDKKLCSATFEYKERQNMFFACMNRQLSRPRLVKIKSLFETLDQELKNEYPSFFNALFWENVAREKNY